MKKNIIIALLITTNCVTALCLAHYAWHRFMWRSQAMSMTKFAAEVWAHNNFDKGKQIKLNLVITDEPTGGDRLAPTELDGNDVLVTWFGYTYPWTNSETSPSVLISRDFVDKHNQEMAEILSDKATYENRRQKEITHWQKEVLNKLYEEPETAGE